MAVVWEAHDDVLARTVAVKVLAARYADDPASRDRIRQEARAAAALSHPNIAQVHDYGETPAGDGVVPYVVMELIPGSTLQQRVSAGRVPPAFAMRVCAEVAAALAAAHAEAIVHRDVKPANVMLAPTGAKVVDFGIAAAVAPGRTDGEFEVLGTPAYLAPERLIDDVVEPASDVYALGVVLYQLLAGRSPWTSETTTQMLSAHVYLDPEPLPDQPGVPDYVTALCNRCLYKDPSMRPSAREAAALLAQGAQLRVVTVDRGSLPAAPAVDAEPSVVIPAASAASQSPARPPAAPPAPRSPGSARPVGSAAVGSVGARSAGPSPAGSPGSAGPPGSGAATGRPGHRVRRWAAVAVPLLAAAVTAGWALWPDDPGATPVGPQGALPEVTPSAASPVPTPGSAQGTPGGTHTGQSGATIAPARTGANPASPGGGARPDATGTPGGQTGGGQPGAPGTPTPSPPAPTTAAPPIVRTLTSSAGSVDATCRDADTAQILSWTPTKPYKVKQADGNAGPAPSVVFKHGVSIVTMTVTCTADVPSATVTSA